MRSESRPIQSAYPVRRYEECRPDELASILRESPIIFWPLGLIEHHGWHLPLGLDGIKAERICQRIAQETGGILMPTMWWGAGGGHGGFMWTCYQPQAAAEAILANAVNKMVVFGFRAIVLLAGHYPWQQILDKHLPTLQQAHPEILFLWGTEKDIGGEIELPGDHAAREETSYGLHLLPEFVDMDALRPGRDASAWPAGAAPDVAHQVPGLCLDPADPLFAQLGQDARTASADRGALAVSLLVDHLASKINGHLDR